MFVRTETYRPISRSVLSTPHSRIGALCLTYELGERWSWPYDATALFFLQLSVTHQFIFIRQINVGETGNLADFQVDADSL